MIILALDISTTVTGYAIIDNQLKLKKYGQFSIQERQLSDILYSVAIKNKIKNLVESNNISELVIEDVFFGKNIENLKTWCRVHGTVGSYWLESKNKEPIFIQAISARKVNGINGQCTKIEVQLEMSHRYQLIKSEVYYYYCGELGKFLKEKNEKTITKNQFDYQIKRLSKQFEELTGVSEHIADAILLGRSYFLKKDNKNV